MDFLLVGHVGQNNHDQAGTRRNRRLRHKLGLFLQQDPKFNSVYLPCGTRSLRGGLVKPLNRAERAARSYYFRELVLAFCRTWHVGPDLAGCRVLFAHADRKATFYHERIERATNRHLSRSPFAESQPKAVLT